MAYPYPLMSTNIMAAVRNVLAADMTTSGMFSGLNVCLVITKEVSSL